MRLLSVALMAIFLSALSIGCSSGAKNTMANKVVKTVDTQHAEAVNQAVQLQVGWYPYSESELVQIGPNQYAVRKIASQSGKKQHPGIAVYYPSTGKTIWIDMDIDDATLGRLLKHSLMGDREIERPFRDFMQSSDCASCHPGAVATSK
jgi:hypothetical protein